MSYSLVAEAVGIDLLLFQSINELCGQNIMADHIASVLDSTSLKGLIFMSTFGALWFSDTNDVGWRREVLVRMLFAVLFSLVVARAVADLLPLRLRPLGTSGIDYRPPLFPLPTNFEGWSSFPSDNATLVFVITAWIWSLSKWWGLLWVSFSSLAMAARVYLGIHYPGDVIAGALIGLGVSFLVRKYFDARVPILVLSVEQRSRPLFYGLFLPFLYEISTLFDFTRMILRSLSRRLIG